MRATGARFTPAPMFSVCSFAMYRTEYRLHGLQLLVCARDFPGCQSALCIVVCSREGCSAPRTRSVAIWFMTSQL